MVLSSQSPRDGHTRQYMVSRRRRFQPVRWLIGIIVLALIAYGGYALFGGGATKASSPSEARASDTPAAPPTNHGDVQTVVSRVDQLPPPQVPDAPAGDSAASGRSAAVPASANDAPTSSTTVFSLGGQPPAKLSTTSDNANLAPAGNPIVPVPATPTPAALQQASSAAANSYAGSSDPDFTRGMSLIANQQWVQGRKVLSHVLFSDSALSPADAQTIRDTLTSVNQQLVFSDKAYPGDQLAQTYKVQRGDLLARIAPRYHIPYEFIERINHVKGRNLRAGQTIKLIKGPFNVRIYKQQFLMDVYLNAPDGLPIYVCSFHVGLGKDNATPIGDWMIQAGHKVVNPGYTNPRTGKHIDRNDPNNPVGEYWMGLEGVGAKTKGMTSYGIHGTIDPNSIGHEDSMGCIRLRAEDIKHLFYMLDAGESRVQVLP